MVNRQPCDPAPPQARAAPVVKRKRRASCLGEQERRERKRAIDREAQRSLREKTKTHIAELERTIQILRDQDRNGATANFLSEIDALRAENERLRGIIESVKGVLGCDSARSGTAPGTLAVSGRGPEHSSAASSDDQQSSNQRIISFADDTKPGMSTPVDLEDCIPVTNRALDLDGMTILNNTQLDTPSTIDTFLRLELDTHSVAETPEHEVEEIQRDDETMNAWWASMMADVFGYDWQSPSPVVLHIGNPDPLPNLTPNKACPIWKKSNELYNKVFQYPSLTGTRAVTDSHSEVAEAGLLFLGIQTDWHKSNQWMQSPALRILKEVDDLLFARLPKTERLAVLYKSFKLLRYYLNATKAELNKVPRWLRPSRSQSSTKHPISIDFFAWPTLRDRLVQNHHEMFETGALSVAYSQFVHFDWPFAFEDMFFFDDLTGVHFPSPLFERYHRDLKYWTVDGKFYERFPELVSDIEGDRRRFRGV
ncbi:hypothetical protein GQ44DRAFT_650016 [Phaeosphaeriaceae sp. PMI808]|nr:hypothetical protein GQ44DRAFT_650016 [Phaeosphaeriaceae sp. PMI808]